MPFIFVLLTSQDPSTEPFAIKKIATVWVISSTTFHPKGVELIRVESFDCADRVAGVIISIDFFW